MVDSQPVNTMQGRGRRETYLGLETPVFRGRRFISTLLADGRRIRAPLGIEGELVEVDWNSGHSRVVA
jgi:hypothetical protein